MMMNDTVKNIKVKGSVGLSPVILHMPKNYQILNRLLMPSFSKHVPWMAYRLLYQSGIPYLNYDENIEMDESKMTYFKETVFYNIKGDDYNIIVEFKGVEPSNILF